MAFTFSKSSNLNNSIFGKSQAPIKAFLEEQDEAFSKLSIIPYVFVEDKTSNFGEKYSYETSLGNFEPVGENGSYPVSSFQEGFSKTIEPDEWKLSFRVTQTMIEDAKFGKVKSQSKGFMLSYYRTRELFASSILNNGFRTSFNFGKSGKTFDISCADGQPLFSSAHPSKTGGTEAQSNLFNLPFSYDNLSKVEEAMQYTVDDDGNLLALTPDTIVISDRSRIKRAVLDAIGASETPGTANHGYNYHYGRWNVVISPYVDRGITGTNDDSWFLIDSNYNESAYGLIWLSRLDLNINSYVDDNTDANIFKGRSRYGAAPNSWRAFAGSFPGLSL